MLLKYNPVSKVAVYGFMNPVFGAILSAPLLEEEKSFGWRTLVSLVFVSVGMVFTVSKQNPVEGFTFRNEVANENR